MPGRVARGALARQRMRASSSWAIDPADWGLVPAGAAFLAAAALIGFAGFRLSKNADRLADRTGIGEALAGALLLGATTSAPGSVLSVVAAAGGHVELTMSHAIGGILAQTAWLSLADLLYRGANLEHAAASAANIVQATLLVVLLGLIVLAVHTPDVTVWAVHPATPIVLAVYVLGLRVVDKARTGPMWQPRATSDTRTDEPQADSEGRSLGRLWAEFATLAVTVSFAGLVLERASESIVERAGVDESVVGGLLATAATSLPELVTTVSAVRRGALTLAVGGIIGGNAYDSLFFAISDFAYRDGSIYHRATDPILAMLAVAIVMSAVLVMGMIRRERHGIMNIGFESFAVLVLYAGAVALLLSG